MFFTGVRWSIDLSKELINRAASRSLVDWYTSWLIRRGGGGGGGGGGGKEHLLDS